MKLNEFAYKKSVGVLSTCGEDHKPSAASVFFNIEKDKIYFLTNSDSDKAKDISKNPNICLNITDDTYYKQLQIYGTAKIITSIDGHYEKIQQTIKEYSEKTHEPAPYTEIFTIDHQFVEVEITPLNGKYFESGKSITEETY
jgi:general stress protein 26